MQKPQKFLVRMSIFVAAVAAIIIVLNQALLDAFTANIAINGVIIFVLLVGTVFAYRRVFDLNPEIEWIKAFKRHEAGARSTNPQLMAPAAALLSEQEEGGMRLSALSMRSVLDGIASRLEESREISRYFTGLLIFLGLLGTFWGLLDTVGSFTGTLGGLTVDGSDAALMFDELKAGLEAPLAGMGTAFSSSLFGLAGSLILGFLDLQASQAQTRFYNEVEDWLASVTKLSRGDEGGMSSPSAYMTALMEQTADGIDRLQRRLKDSEAERRQLQTTMTSIAESLSGLSDKLGSQEAAISQTIQRSEAGTRELASAIEKLAASTAKQEQPVSPPALDEASKQHLRNLDVGIKVLTEEQSRQSTMLAEELRAEIKLLSRTIAAVFDRQNDPKTPQTHKAQASLRDEIDEEFRE